MFLFSGANFLMSLTLEVHNRYSIFKECHEFKNVFEFKNVHSFVICIILLLLFFSPNLMHLIVCSSQAHLKNRCTMIVQKKLLKVNV